jgi:hypothetical protein
MIDTSKDKEASRRLLVQLVGMRLTDAFYDGNEIVLEFDRNYRLQVSPAGCEVLIKKGAPPLDR